MSKYHWADDESWYDPSEYDDSEYDSEYSESRSATDEEEGGETESKGEEASAPPLLVRAATVHTSRRDPVDSAGRR